MPSSLVSVSPASTEADGPGQVELTRPLLTEVLARIPDPRDPRGVRHLLGTVLAIAQAAVVAGVGPCWRSRSGPPTRT